MNSASLQLVGEKLKSLTELHERLTVLRAGRRALRASGSASPELEAQIKLLERQIRQALDEMQAAYAAMKITEGPGGLEDPR